MAEPHKGVTTKGMQGYEETRLLIRTYVSTLRKAAFKFEKDNGAGAHYAIAATVRFLTKLKVPGHLYVPLYEAARAIQRDMGVNTAAAASLGRQRDIIDAIALDLQRRCGVSVAVALRNIVGNDPDAATHVSNFRKGMLSRKKSIPAGAKAIYDYNMNTYFKGLPPQEAASKALGMCKAIRGTRSIV